MISQMRAGRGIAVAKTYVDPIATSLTLTVMVAVTAVAAAALAGCFYTDSINSRPIATIDTDGEAPRFLKQIYRLTAGGSVDGDGDALSFHWTLRSCPVGAACLEPPFLEDEGVLVEFSFPSRQPVAVTLEARDPRGAISTQTRTFTPENRPPVVELQPIDEANPSGCFTVGRLLRFVAGASDPDGDTPTLSWQLTVPPISNPNVLVHGEGADGTYAIRPDVDAPSWIIQVTATDDTGATDDEQRPFCTDPDQPPCIEVTDPGVQAGAIVTLPRQDGTRTFRVETVVDDLDPFPFPGGSSDDQLDGPDFRWYLGPAAAPPPLVAGHETSDFLVDPAAYEPGARLSLRVEVSDRKVRPPCAPELASCEATPGSGCPQRVTWTLEVR